LVLYHWPLYTFILSNLNFFSSNGFWTFFTVVLIASLTTVLAISLLTLVSFTLAKVFSGLAAIVNALALYFMLAYQVILDKTMMSNVLNTQSTEALAYLHPKMLIYVFVFGLLPALLLFKVQIIKKSRLRLLIHNLTFLLIALVLIYLNSSSWLWLDKNSKILGSKIVPWSYLINTVRIQNLHLDSLDEQHLLPPAHFSNDEKTVVVLVIGETARAQNFSLYGYNRTTNPLLSKRQDLTVLPNATSCSTYTTASLRCILSHKDNPGSDEPLPSYLQRMGVDVTWRTRNWGEPPIHVAHYQKRQELKKICQGIGCNYDEVLLSGLKQQILSSSKKKVFVVLHQKGSHGPSYYSEYPEQFEVFKPSCKSVELSQCSQQELINAYDNTLLYTDHFLARLIQLLEGLNNTSTVMLYLSDHGESLGEYGLYLHGTPYSIAPDVQKKIPFLVWMSKQFRDSRGLKKTLTQKRDEYSHHNEFHSIMGAFDIIGIIYNEERDIFHSPENELNSLRDLEQP
ncbi:MAG: phosphoethanolamine--lipid A transferase EptA, partial [Gammaproteobacteria bacterium]|nr:phosphoethanolamine--lipid A transferase EptA [Gammaproteobacteria bacterium]